MGKVDKELKETADFWSLWLASQDKFQAHLFKINYAVKMIIKTKENHYVNTSLD